jgi:hypothetical protein
VWFERVQGLNDEMLADVAEPGASQLAVAQVDERGPVGFVGVPQHAGNKVEVVAAESNAGTRDSLSRLIPGIGVLAHGNKVGLTRMSGQGVWHQVRKTVNLTRMTGQPSSCVTPSPLPSGLTGIEDSLSAVSAHQGQRYPYGDVVGSDEVDGEAWARLLMELLASAGMTPEQAAAPQGPVSVNWRTIRRWLSGQSGASAVKVRDVCRELGYPRLDALVRVGFLTSEEARMSRRPVSPAPPLPDLLRQIADVLADKRIPDQPKQQLQAGVQAALDMWLAMLKLRAPREPAIREETADQS